MNHPIKKLLVANRGEMANRVMRAAAELGIRTVAVFSHEDRLALRRFKAEEGHALQLDAPMPGMGATVAVKAGQRVARGTPLLSIEAMKMENAISAEREGVVARVLVAPGEQVLARDLLLEFAESS